MKRLLARLPFTTKFAIPAVVSMIAMALIGLSFLQQMHRVTDLAQTNLVRAATSISQIVNEDFDVSLELSQVSDDIRSLNSDFYELLLTTAIGQKSNTTYLLLRQRAKGIMGNLRHVLEDHHLPDHDRTQLAQLTAALKINYLGTNADGIFDVAEQMAEVDINLVLDGLTNYQTTYTQMIESIQSTTNAALLRSSLNAKKIVEEKDTAITAFQKTGSSSTMRFQLYFGLFLILCGLAAYIISHHTTRSVRDIADTTEQLAKGDTDIDIVALSRSDELKSIVHALEVFRDNLIDLKRIQQEQAIFIEELTRAREEALAASKAKSDFLANMSHELRTPLNSAMGMIALAMKEIPVESEAQHMLITAQHAGDTLVKMMGDILDLTKIEAGKLSLEESAFDLRDIATKSLRVHHYTADKKGLAYRSTFHQAGAPIVVGDAMRFGQILSNLAGNAVKFTESGNVDVDIDWEETGDELAISIKVTDTGVGISPGDQARIFDKFFQADASINRRFGGSGLGLTITKQLIESMHGTIHIDSRVGVGTVFSATVLLPLADAATLAQQSVIREDKTVRHPGTARLAAGAARILVAEDHPMNKLFIEQYLKKTGLKNYRICENGADALAAFKDEPFDLVLMDCHMPVMNGYEATQGIRAHAAATGAPHTPIIALTADAMAGTREKCLAAGMDDYLSKPIDVAKLSTIIGQWIELPA